MFLFNKAEEENSSLKIMYCEQMNSTSLIIISLSLHGSSVADRSVGDLSES